MLSVTTKTGDKGESGLANGERLSKTDPVFETIGTLDELNSWLGLVAAKLEKYPDQQEKIFSIQEKLFILGGIVSKSPQVRWPETALADLESWTEEIQAHMAEGWHTKFLYPGGTELGAYLDLARTVCRRCERRAWKVSAENQASQNVTTYLNRLSDFLYVLRCWVNAQVEFPEKKFQNKK